MEYIRKQFANELKNLEVEECEEISAKILSKKFKRKALKVHSDKTRTQDDEEFKQLLHDYNKLKEALSEINENVEDEQTDLQTFFEHTQLRQRVLSKLDNFY